MHRPIRTESRSPIRDAQSAPLGIETASITEAALPISAPAPSPQAVAAYAAEVKALTNYEVWKGLESMILTLVPGQEADNDDWWHFRLLLDELQWRLSGLEGAGSAPSRLRLAA